MKDKLDDIFDKQIHLQSRIHYGDRRLPDVQLDKIPMTVTSIVAELGEILHAQHGWKDYHQSTVPIRKKDLDLEVADLWHFVINLTMQLGYSAEETYDCFLKKNKINHERQDLK